MARLVTLDDLRIEGTKITDAGLAELKVLENLRALYIERTETTKQGVALLKEAMPRTYVSDGRDEDSGFVRYYDPVGSASWSLDDSDPADQQPAKPASEIKPVEQSSAEPPSSQSPAGQKALGRLKELGASWSVPQPIPGFAPKGDLAFRLGISFGDDWKGTAEDWKLLEAVDHPEELNLGLFTDRLEGLSQVKLAAPLAQVILRVSSAKPSELEACPPAGGLFSRKNFSRWPIIAS